MTECAEKLDLTHFSGRLTCGPQGIWYAGSSESVSYPGTGHDACLEVEEDSFWFRHRNQCILAAVRRFHQAERGAIFDVGAGNGFVARALADAGWAVVAVEPGPAGARHACERGLVNVVCGTTQTCGFTPASIPAIGVFDVVEHVQRDVEFMVHLSELLQPGGHLFLTVPAHAALWSVEDVAAGHWRRYDRHAIRTLVLKAGLELVYVGYIFRWLPAPIAMLRALPWRLGLSRDAAKPAAAKAQHAVGTPRLARLLEAAFASEVTAVAEGREIGFGASLLAVARRPL